MSDGPKDYAAKKEASMRNLVKFEELSQKFLTQIRDLKSMLGADRLRAADLRDLLHTYDSIVQEKAQESMMDAVEKCRLAMSELHQAESADLDKLLTDTGLDAVLAVKMMKGKDRR